MISVLYLAYELSRNTTNVQAANTLVISSQTMEVRSQQIENTELNEIILKASDLDAMRASERNRFFCVHTQLSGALGKPYSNAEPRFTTRWLFRSAGRRALHKVQDFRLSESLGIF